MNEGESNATECPEKMFALALSHYRSGRLDEAMEAFQRTQKDTRFRDQSRSYLRKCLVEKGLSEVALETLDEALRSKSKSA